MARLVELLPNYEYEATINLPSASALGQEVGAKLLTILDRLHRTDPSQATDELLAIARFTRYPLPQSWSKKAVKSHPDLDWLTDDMVDITDYLISHTLDSPMANGTSTFNSILLTTLYWFLTRESCPLSTYLKSYDLNTTYGGFMVSDYLTYLK